MSSLARKHRKGPLNMDIKFKKLSTFRLLNIEELSGRICTVNPIKETQLEIDQLWPFWKQ